MNIGEAFRLINEFVIFTTDIHNIFKAKDPSILSNKFLEIRYRRISDHKYEISLSEDYICETFYICSKTGFTHTEELIIKNIIGSINRLKDVLSYNEMYMVLKSVQLDTLLQAIYKIENGNYVSIFDRQSRKIIINHITKMDEWSCQTYENEKFSFTLGIEVDSKESSKIHIYDLYNDGMLKVLSSGSDTIIVCNKNGDILRYEKLASTAHKPRPLLYNKISNWSKGRMAIVLSTLGEILVFYDQSFLYLKRAGKWYPAKKSPLSNKMDEACGYNREMKEAIIDTCYDVSFLRCGACIGIIDDNCPLIYDIDKYMTAETPRAAFFRQILGNRKFQEIDREIRQELAGIDGATVIDKTGRIIAVGAILKINASSVQNRITGGRSVAAQQLAEYGIGIKISADGSIEAWKKNSAGILEKFIEVL